MGKKKEKLSDAKLLEQSLQAIEQMSAVISGRRQAVEIFQRAEMPIAEILRGNWELITVLSEYLENHDSISDEFLEEFGSVAEELYERFAMQKVKFVPKTTKEIENDAAARSRHELR